MSLKGQIYRGEKWYGFRDLDGNLPLDFTENMKNDIQAYLKSIEDAPVAVKKPSKKWGK